MSIALANEVRQLREEVDALKKSVEAIKDRVRTIINPKGKAPRDPEAPFRVPARPKTLKTLNLGSDPVHEEI
jgi:hypothetical protein